MKIYRPNVGICLLNKENLIFAGNRFLNSNSKDGWQMPQGGVVNLEEEEILLDGMYRELFEETGITKTKVKILKRSEKIRYDFPAWVLEENKKNFGKKFWNVAGQEQIWFYLQFLGEDSDINLETDKENQEFFSWKWVTKDFLLQNIIEMKKEVYQKVLKFSSINL